MAGQYRIELARSRPELRAGVLVNVQAWQQSYRGFLGDDVIDQRATEEAIEARADDWAAAALAGTSFWIASDRLDGHVVGVANACPARDEDAPTALELAMLYVLDEAKGSGLADALLQTAIGDAPAYLWTFAGNERAFSFYRRHGFVLDGATKLAGNLTTSPSAPVPTELRLVRLG